MAKQPSLPFWVSVSPNVRGTRWCLDSTQVSIPLTQGAAPFQQAHCALVQRNVAWKPWISVERCPLVWGRMRHSHDVTWACEVKRPQHGLVPRDGERTLQPTPPLSTLGFSSRESTCSLPSHQQCMCEDPEKRNKATRQCQVVPRLTLDFDEVHICEIFRENTHFFSQQI